MDRLSIRVKLSKRNGFFVKFFTKEIIHGALSSWQCFIEINILSFCIFHLLKRFDFINQELHESQIASFSFKYLS